MASTTYMGMNALHAAGGTGSLPAYQYLVEEVGMVVGGRWRCLLSLRIGIGRYPVNKFHRCYNVIPPSPLRKQNTIPEGEAPLSLSARPGQISAPVPARSLRARRPPAVSVAGTGTLQVGISSSTASTSPASTSRSSSSGGATRGAAAAPDLVLFEVAIRSWSSGLRSALGTVRA